MGLFAKPDPFQCGAYVTDGRVLFEIVGRDNGLVELENVVTGWRHTRPVGNLSAMTFGGSCNWTLVKPAPEVPDQP